MRQFWLAAVCFASVNAGAYDLLECPGVHTPIAAAICEDTDLARTNRNLNQAYRSILDHGTLEQIARADALLERLVSDRDQCGADLDCLTEHYNESASSLIDFHNLDVIDNPCLIILGNAHTENACANVHAIETDQALTAAFENARDRFVAFHSADKQLSDDTIQRFRDAWHAEFDAWKKWRDTRCDLLLVIGFGGQATTNSHCLVEMNEQRSREYETQNVEEGY